MTVLIVEDHPLMRMALRAIFRASAIAGTFIEAHDVPQAMGLLGKANYDVVICDISLPGQSGLEFVSEVKRTKPKLPVIVYSLHNTPNYAIQAYRQGAWAYVQKDEEISELVNALNAALEGRRYASAGRASLLASFLSGEQQVASHELLSRREKEVLLLLGSGLTPKEVSTRLSLSIKTVSTYQARIVAKLRLRVGRDIIRYCYEHGLNS